MKILLDTCTFLWIASNDDQLSKRARALFTDPDNEVYMSAVSSWEIAVKFSAGKLKLPKTPNDFIQELRQAHEIASLPLEEKAALYVPHLPKLHGDPFDRMLICQSIVHGMAILTPDPEITRYPVHTVW